MSRIKNKLVTQPLDLESYGEDLDDSLCNLLDALLRSKKGNATRLIAAVSSKFAVSAGAGYTIFGFATTFGVASTGTAIGTLHGAALTSATMAWLGGSVAAGTAIFTAATIIPGILMGFTVNYWLRRKAKDRVRSIEQLSEKEKILVTGIESILVSLRSSKQPELSYNFLLKHNVLPIVEEVTSLLENEYKGWPEKEHQRLVVAVRKLLEQTRKADGRLSDIATFGISAFGAALIKLTIDNVKYSANDHLVFKAIVRSTSELDDSSTLEDIAAYVNQYPDTGPSKRGFIANVKGIYHEIKFASDENQDEDDWYMELSEKTNEPAIDAWMVNSETGQRIPYQLKATDNPDSFDTHYDKYPDVEAIGTEEIADQREDVYSSGYSNEQLDSETTEAVGKLESEGTPLLLAQESASLGSTAAFIAMTLTLADSIRTRGSPHNASRMAARQAKRSFIICAGLYAMAELVI